MSIKLLAFAASHRPESHNRKLASYAAKLAQAQGVIIDFAEYADFDMPVYNDHEVRQNNIPAAARSFLNRCQQADGIIIASPEYNWSYPGSLKNIIDWTSVLGVSALKHKTALLLCATPSSRGGIIGLEHLRSPLTALNMHVFNRAFPLGGSEQAFDVEGNLNQDKQYKLLQIIVSEFVTFTQKLSNN